MKLIDGSSERIFSRILNVMTKIQDEAAENEFVGKTDRLFSSDISCLIVEDKRDVGFLYLLSERKNGLYFLDMALLKEYRNKGIGFLALKELLDSYNYSEFVLGEVKEDNTACLSILNKLNSIKVSENHYLLQPERIEEFKEFISKNNIDLNGSYETECDDFEMLFGKREDKPKVKVKGK